VVGYCGLYSLWYLDGGASQQGPVLFSGIVLCHIQPSMHAPPEPS